MDSCTSTSDTDTVELANPSQNPSTSTKSAKSLRSSYRSSYLTYDLHEVVINPLARIRYSLLKWKIACKNGNHRNLL